MRSDAGGVAHRPATWQGQPTDANMADVVLRLSFPVVLASFALLGCAMGDDGIVRRGTDGGGSPGVDAQRPPTEGCDPPCSGGQVCRDRACVAPETDADMDGVPADRDCDDLDASLGATGERACASACGDGVERCVDGRWEACSAPSTCDCAAGSPPRELACERCGVQRQVCVEGMWMNDGGCMGMGACAPGAVESGGSCGMCGSQERRCNVDCTWGPMACLGEGECRSGEVQSESRDCPGGCGTQTRRREWGASCSWGAWSAWSTCGTCGPVCGNGTCEAGETCSACVDCQYGHEGTGSGGSSCGGAPENHWRCVTQPGLGVVSQVCRSGSWVNFNLNPRNCGACVCSFSASCCQTGSTSGGC